MCQLFRSLVKAWFDLSFFFFGHRENGCARARFVFYSSATRRRAPPIGLLPALSSPPLVLLTATLRRNCPKTARAAPDSRAAGLGRVWPWCAVDAEGRKNVAALICIVMEILLKCSRCTFNDACFIFTSSPTVCCDGSVMRLTRSCYYFAASLA